MATPKKTETTQNKTSSKDKAVEDQPRAKFLDVMKAGARKLPDDFSRVAKGLGERMAKAQPDIERLSKALDAGMAEVGGVPPAALSPMMLPDETKIPRLAASEFDFPISKVDGRKPKRVIYEY